MFRSSASPNPLSDSPPTSYKGNLLAVASGEKERSVSRRHSRTDLDFEQALLNEGTVKLREGPDISLLGVPDSPLSPRRAPTSPVSKSSSNKLPRPPTPTVIPPTPTPAAGLRSDMPVSPSPLPEGLSDNEVQSKRRSIFRSPGTASSPDLATLVKKAREKATTADSTQASGSGSNKESITVPQSSSSGLLAPNGGSTSRTRPRSNTASARKLVAKTPPSSYYSSEKGTVGSSSTKGKVKASPYLHHDRNAPVSSKENLALQSGKSSMRQKTSAFLGKLVGQGSMRDKSRGMAVNPGRVPPPVPPVPDRYRLAPSDSHSDSSEKFYSLPSSPDLGKPLPIVSADADNAENLSGSDDEYGRPITSARSSMTAQDRRAFPSSPRASTSTASHRRSESGSSARKRSMSTGTVMRQVLTTPSTIPTLELPTDLAGSEGDWDLTMRESQRNPPEAKSRTSDWNDPFLSSPAGARRPTRPERALSDETPKGSAHRVADMLSRRTSMPHKSGNDPQVTATALRAASLDVPSNQATPHRTVSHPTSSPSSSSSPRSTGSRQGQLPVRPSFTNVFVDETKAAPTPNPSDVSRLKMHSRSPASASEPALLGMIAASTSSGSQDPSNATVRLVSTRSSNMSAGNSRDSSVFNMTVSNFSSASNPSNSEDLQQRGLDLALRCWHEEPDFLAKEKIAEWLGGIGLINKVALRQYMQQFDFCGLRLDNAFRKLCAKLFLKAETQQVDRILDEFGQRYWECNPDSLYRNSSTVHAVAYSLLLLNTDLHVAELTSHMSRTQFVKNTFLVITSQDQASITTNPSLSSPTSEGDASETVEGNKILPRTNRSGSVTSWNSQLKESVSTASGSEANDEFRTNPPSSNQSASGTPSVRSYSRTWDAEMETLLKDMYNAIKSQQILQATLAPPSERSLHHGSPNSLLRAGSRRGQSADRLNSFKRGSIRGLQSLIVNSHGVSPYSSNSSIDGRISPSPSYATSTADTFSASSSSFFSTPTFGFASNLTHTIIKESEEAERRSLNSQESNSTDVSVSDAELALLGPPFAKEGSLCRKQYWEATSRRAKSKAWMDVFVVIQKGDLDMFVFGGGDGISGQVVGGGNWLSNASHVGSLSLAHSLAHSLPPPGYSRQRPYCFVLTLSTGAVYFFQAGTEDLVNEWVSTCNYWAARQSKEPLAGGVSNMEYGWNRVLPGVGTEDHMDTLSMRSARSVFGKRSFTGSSKDRISGSPYVDRTVINDWKPPLPPTVPSPLDEEAQLEAMEKQVASLNEELEAHQALQAPMLELYVPRGVNAAKALQNWKNRSQHLTSEIVKYDIYVDALKAAMVVRHKRRGEKALERALVTGDPSEDSPSNLQPSANGERVSPRQAMSRSPAGQGTITSSRR